MKAALRLAQHNKDLVENWTGPKSWEQGPREPVKPILDRIEGLQRDLEHSPRSGSDPDRRNYLAAQLRSLHVIAERLLGESMPFDREAEEFLGATTPPVNESATAAARDQLARELPGTASLADRLAAFRKRFVVAAPREDAVMKAALAACRAETVKVISLPGDEQVDFEFTQALGFDGFADYEGRHHTRISIERATDFDITRALHLACHEGYPGHHVQFLLIDDTLATKNRWLEFQLTPAFGRHLLISEGAAEAATAIAFPPEARRRVYRDQLFPAAGLPIGDVDRLVRVEELVNTLEPVITDTVRAYLDNDLTRAKAVVRLKDEGLIPDPDDLLDFAEKHRARMLAYPAGKMLVERLIARDGLAGVVRLFAGTPFRIE